MRTINPRERLTELARKQQELMRVIAEAKYEAETHPLKPLEGKKYTYEETQAWAEAKRDITARRLRASRRLQELKEEGAKVKGGLSQQPLSKLGFADLIDRLVKAEQRFDVSPDEAHLSLTAAIDWLEQEERRIFIEEQVARLQGA